MPDGRAMTLVAMEPRAYYTVKLTPPADGWARLPQLTERARSVSAELRAEGIEVRLVRSVFVPEDESCFYLFRAASADAVLEAARRAGLRVDRLLEAVVIPDTGAARTTSSQAAQMTGGREEQRS
jgi:Protein of unknown function (DUF4242)